MRSLLIPLIYLILPFVSPSPSPLIPHEHRTHIPSGWSPIRKPNSYALLPLRLALTQPNVHAIETLLLDVSHPHSSNYGNHWSPAQITAKFAPSNHTVDTVRAWLAGSGFAEDRVRVSTSRGWIHINVTVEEAERLLRTEYHVYQHHTGLEHVACDAYHLPPHITPYVDFVAPTIHFDAILGKRDGHPWRGVGRPGIGITPKTTGSIKTLFGDSQLANCDKQITPACLKALYGIPELYKPQVPERNRFGIVEYTPQAYRQSDLDLFAEEFAPDLKGKSPDVIAVDGGVVQMTDQGFEFNGESNLDLQYAMALVTASQPVTLYQVGDLEIGGSFNNFLDALDGSYCTVDGGDDYSADSKYPDNAPNGYNAQDCGTAPLPDVVSTSYGYNEADLSHRYIARQCIEYAKLGLMGVTVLYSSGDDGVAGNGGVCLNPDGSQTRTGSLFNPTFPSTCPYVTSVGATQLPEGARVSPFSPLAPFVAPSDPPETACEVVIASGGGFSNYFARPEWQEGAVRRYLDGKGKGVEEGKWNASGRGYPDISANGANYVVAVDGTFNLVYGTSASTPVLGAILTLVNDMRHALGKSSIGFINPAIYSPAFQHGLNDIKNGSNPGCGTDGFPTAEGWDPVTGLGTPNFMNLVLAWTGKQ